jgi:mannose-6-phosphate isomerase-like protein (cupin superfamily)
MMAAMGYHVARHDDHEFVERPKPEGREADPPRLAAALTEPLGLGQSRAQLWRYPPGARGRRHAEHTQEEVFVVVEGTLTMHLGEPAERIDLLPRSVVSVEPGTPLQLRNDGGDEVVVFVYGAPPVRDGADFLADPEP